jgi:mono/diheme cytochrome c family protein
MGIATIGVAAEKFDFGKREYDTNCAVCHGKTGKGDGPYAGLVDTRIADLTTLSRRNNGVFPFERIVQVIDGRQAVKAHGPRDMPIWGDRYLAASREAYFDVPYDPELYVRTRLLALTDYLSRLQAK